MMKNILLTLLLLFAWKTGWAQPPGNEDPADKMKAQKVAFITAKLDLSSEESAKFWPVYNNYESELKVIRKKRKSELMNAKINFDSMSDAQVSQLIDDEFLYQQQELDLRKKYNELFKQVLPVKKVALLYKAELEWTKEVIQKWSGNHAGAPHGNK